MSVGAAVLLTACQTIYSPDDRPARLRANDTSSHEALNRAVDQLMGNKAEARFRFIQERAPYAQDLDI